MWSVFYFFLFFRNEKYNPITCPILIHRNRLNFTKALIILRFRSEEYFIVFRHNFFFFFLHFNYFHLVQPLFPFHFRQDVMVPFRYRLSLFRPSTFSRQLSFFIASFELEKMKLFSSCVSIVWYGFCAQRPIIEMLERRPVTPLALLILLYLFLPFWIGGKNKTLFRSSFPFFFNFPSLRSTILLYHTFFVTLLKERKVSKECLNLSTKKKKNIYIRIISIVTYFRFQSYSRRNTRNNSSWNKF